MAKAQTLTVAGVTFTASQIKSVTLSIDGHEVKINEPDDKKKKMGFGQEDSKES
jgi:hypothetical protein|tara:strand:- start:299 stop:460 length:162 start_codon:yes stop_codon:yes gene_type:complete